MTSSSPTSNRDVSQERARNVGSIGHLDGDEHLAVGPASPALQGKVVATLSILVHQLFPTNKMPTQKCVFEYDEVKVELSGPEFGVANAWDKQVLYYILSMIGENTDVSPAANTFTFEPADYFRVARIGNPGGSQHHQLIMSLKRLRNTAVRTTIGSGELEMTDFSWLSAYKVNWTGEGEDMRIKTVTVDVPRVLVTTCAGASATWLCPRPIGNSP
ncbi:replication initiator protein A, partial [Azospirillum sp. B4]|uniref:replication initiator protein A n=1 Tax=Azospirillum sp. B4 TaxID=95605 RepID=UPI00190232DD